MIKPFTTLDPQRRRQTCQKVQPDSAPLSLPQHEREQGELEDERMRQDNDDQEMQEQARRCGTVSEQRY